MTKQIINVGTAANDRKGDSLRAAFQKVNANFTELYVALGLDSGGLNLGNIEFTGSTITTTDSSSITLDQKTILTSQLDVGMEIFARNLRHVSSTSGLKQIYFDPATGELVVLD